MDYTKKIADLERKIENQQKEIEVMKRAFAELGVILADVHKASEKGGDA